MFSLLLAVTLSRSICFHKACFQVRTTVRDKHFFEVRHSRPGFYERRNPTFLCKQKRQTFFESVPQSGTWNFHMVHKNCGAIPLNTQIMIKAPLPLLWHVFLWNPHPAGSHCQVSRMPQKQTLICCLNEKSKEHCPCISISPLQVS